MKKVTTAKEMKRSFSRNLATYSKVCFVALALGLGACKDDDPIDPEVPGVTQPSEIVEVQAGNITGNVKWTADKIYRLNGFVRVGEDKTADGQPTQTGTLTIEPGTIIIGDRESKGTLIVQRGSKIIAQGTKEKPIVFTSERPAGQREPGDWGGVVICGRAKTNLAGGVGELEGQYGGFYGGNDDNDNSGVLEYVRIEFAGIPINPNQEVNSLTLGAVGSATKIENIQCSYGLDDSFEWFGGSVNAKNLIAYRGLDDDFDMDNGFHGKVQFAIAIRDNKLSDQSGSNGIEADNDGGATNNTPHTTATISNLTLIGPKKTNETAITPQFANAAHLKKNVRLRLHNSFITGFPVGILIDGGSTNQNAQNDELKIRNTVLAGVQNWGTNGFGTAALSTKSAPDGFDINTWFKTASFNNQLLTKWQDAGIDASVFDLGTPKLALSSNSPLLTGSDFAGLTGFQNVPFRGAFGTEDWTAGWAEWSATTKQYLP